MLKFSSLISLHEPLMGRLFHSGRFDAARFNRILDVGSGPDKSSDICSPLLAPTAKSSALTSPGNVRLRPAND
jgi:hypothetical protein